jgi:hypothetical protein
MKLETDFEAKTHALRAAEVIRNLKPRQINGYYFDSVSDGIDKVIDLIPPGVSVGLGGSTTLIQSGLMDRLRELPVTLYDRYREGVTKEEISAMRTKSLIADVFIASTNAITIDGQLVNVDGIGNRVAAMINGPGKVILLAGVNKIVDSVESGLERIHAETAPINVQRFGAETPCRDTGVCDREICRAPKSICNKYVVIEGEWDKDRLHVILVGERLGF